MENLVLKPLLLLVVLGGRWVLPLPLEGQEATPADASADLPDLDTAEAHNRFAVFHPLVDEVNDHHSWGPPPWSRPAAAAPAPADPRPNPPWYTSPRRFLSILDEENVASESGGRLHASSSSLSSSASASSSSSRHAAPAPATDHQEDGTSHPPSFSPDSLNPTRRQLSSSSPTVAPPPSSPAPRSSPSRGRGSPKAKSKARAPHTAAAIFPEPLPTQANPSFPRSIESNSFRVRGKGSPPSQKLVGSSKYPKNTDALGQSRHKLSKRQVKQAGKKAPWGRQATQSGSAPGTVHPQDTDTADPGGTGGLADPMDTMATQTSNRYTYVYTGRSRERARKEEMAQADTTSVSRRPLGHHHHATTDFEPDRTPGLKPPPPPQRPNHSLRLHRHQSTFPFESEVRGDGYHTRIRFDPFGSTVPLKDQQSPRGQTFGNWALRPVPSGPGQPPALPHPNPTSHTQAYHPQRDRGRPTSVTASSFSRPHPTPPSLTPESKPHLRPPPLAPESRPRPRPPPLAVENTGFQQTSGNGQPFGSSPPAPVTARPFLNPGNLVGVAEGVGPEDDPPPVADEPQSHTRPSDSHTPAQHTNSHAASAFDVHPQENLPSSFNFDYPSVANVFDDDAGAEEHLDRPESTNVRREYWPANGPHRPPENRFHSAHQPGPDPDTQHSFPDPPLPVGGLNSPPPKNPQDVSLVEEGGAPQEAAAGTGTTDYPIDYYDDLYDEFLDMYYNLEGDYGQAADVVSQAGDASQPAGGEAETRTTTPDPTATTTEFTATPPPTTTTAPPPSTTTTPAPPPSSTTTTTTTPEPLPSTTTTTTTTTPAPPPPTTTTTTTPTPSTTTTTTTTPTPPTTTTTTTPTPPPRTTTTTTTTTPAPPPSTTTTTPARPSTTTTTTTPPPPPTTTTTTTTTTTATSTSTTPGFSRSATTTSRATTTPTAGRPSAGSEEVVPVGRGSGDGRQGGGKYLRDRGGDARQGAGTGARGHDATQDKAPPSSPSGSGNRGAPRAGPPISLSEIMQASGMSLPQFLVALKGHGLSLKGFTTSLQAKGLTQSEFKKTRGNLDSLINIITAGGSPTDLDDEAKAPEEQKGTDGQRVTPRPTRRLTTTTTTTTSTTTTTTTTTTEQTTTPPPTSTTEQTTTPPPTSSLRPKIFGFRPGGRPQFSGPQPGKASNDTKDGTDQDLPGKENAPVPIKLDIAGVMKEKGLSASDILHDLGSLFTMAEPDAASDGKPEEKNTSPGENTTNSAKTKEPKEPEVTDDERNKTKALEDNDKRASSSVRPSTVWEPAVSPRPYRPSGGSERYRPRSHQGGGPGGGHRGIITNRLHTTQRPTLRPPYRPPTDGFSSVLNTLHNSTTSTSGNEISFGLPPDPVDARSDLEDVPRRPQNDYFPIYDSDPDSLNMSTKSAILAASILGGVAMCVFLAILVVVMYRGRARLRRAPLALPSDASSSSTPPIYSSRMSAGKAPYKTSGFWGTLKKRFDPYSLSPTPTVMT